MRFDLQAYSTAHFSNRVWVQCPKCTNIGLVKTISEEVKYAIPAGSESATYECSNCDFKLAEKGEWFGFYIGSINRPCGFCGVQIQHRTNPTKELTTNRTVFCGSCKKEKSYEVSWMKSLKDGTVDPYFGMDLVIKTEVKSNTLWFYNLDHLRYVRDYVQATLREDNNRHKYSLISNLPQWVTSAKNRDIIVRKLNKLEKEVSKKIGTLSYGE